MDTLIPFGKYKGQPIGVLQQDTEYLTWLQSQDWFLNRYQSINTLIINNFQEPSETPEHNKIQTLFLNQGICEKLRDYFIENKFLPTTYKSETYNSSTGKWDEKITDYNYDYYSVAFEQKSVDVTICLRSIDLPIEIKPTVSDDYPAIIRQMQANKSKILVCSEYTGQGATLDQVRQIFLKSGKLYFVLLTDFM